MNQDTRNKIIGLILGALIGIAVGIAGLFGIEIFSSCASTGSVDWNVDIVPQEVFYEV